MSTAVEAAPREWVIAPPHAQRERFAADARISPWLAQLLLNRGIASASDIGPFLRPDFAMLHPPGSLPGARQAADILARAIQAGTRIVIYGDYDVDGVTATAILWHCLKLAGARVDYYIPSRFEEGYGLNDDALRRIREDGGELVVTVDCGITARETVARATADGLRIIITDHHEPRGELPDAEAIVHPFATEDRPGAAGLRDGGEDRPGAAELQGAAGLQGEGGGNRDLCGAGVALKVAWALAQRLCGGDRVTAEFREMLLEGTALAALGLIADVVPVTGENRIIATYGLKHLCHTKNPGLLALIEVSGLSGKAKYDDYDVGFTLAPRLNAIGRLGHARLAVELFTRATHEQAAEIARTLDGHNRQRRTVERGIFKTAEEMVRERGFHRDGCHGIVLANAEWHPGVIGIVASRLVERFCRPTVLIALENGQGQGSGRSIRHFPLHEVLHGCGEHLVSYGGHAMAAGLRIKATAVDAFTEAFQQHAGNRLSPADLRPRLMLDDEVDLADLRPEAVDMLERMAPFGVGNERPRFATAEVDLVGPPRVVGKNGGHIQFAVRQNGELRRAVAFYKADQAQAIADAGRLRLAFEPIINEWNGYRRVELKMVDWKPAAR